MMSLTTAQRDLLCHLLQADVPVSAATLGQHLHLTPRQVHYGLREVRPWLDKRRVVMRHTPGLGVQVICTPEQRQRLLADLLLHSKFQLVLTSEQRQQLLALQLLAASEPLILNQFQHDLAVARTTVLKDLEAIEPWLDTFGITIARRQHRGFWVEGGELAKRQMLAALLWGDVPFDRPVMQAQAGQGVVFLLGGDAALLPIVNKTRALVAAWDVGAMQHHVTWAEHKLGGRFTDEAVIHLALALAIQNQRIAADHTAESNGELGTWTQQQAAWPVADAIANALWPALGDHVRHNETSLLTLQLLAGARDEPWRNDHSSDGVLPSLLSTMMHHVAEAYHAPELASDQLLRDGLEVHVLPSTARQFAGLWAPPRIATDTDTDRYATERSVATRIAEDVAAITGIALPHDALDDVVLLLRAAVIRARPEQSRRVLVVCPSGMATTQLLIARLKARFPRLGTFEVLPMRELTPARVADADLIISTVPLSFPNPLPIDIIQVHPMLRPEDVAALTQWIG